MFYRKENGVIVSGPFNCEQSFPTELLDDSSPEVIAFITPNAAKVAIADLELTQILKTTPRARREMDLGSILAIRAIGVLFQTLGTALNQAAVVNAALPLVRIGKVEDKSNPGTWIDTPGVKALMDIQTSIEQKRAQL